MSEKGGVSDRLHILKRRLRLPPLPYPGQSIPDIIEKISAVTVSEVTEPESLQYMEGHEWNIDEINFLAKRMESFAKREKRQFDAIAFQLKPSTGQDLIHQTFNLSRYTLVSDFSSLFEIGKTHVINRTQAMSSDEMASTDFAQIGKDLIVKAFWNHRHCWRFSGYK